MAFMKKEVAVIYSNEVTGLNQLFEEDDTMYIHSDVIADRLEETDATKEEIEEISNIDGYCVILR